MFLHALVPNRGRILANMYSIDKMAEWSKACDSSESLPEFKSSLIGKPAWVRIPLLSYFIYFAAGFFFMLIVFWNGGHIIV